MKQYLDEKGQNHYIDYTFGKDGQGTLYTTKNDLVILRDSEDRDADGKLFDDVKLLPLAEIKNIILPTYKLKDCTGYVMQIPSGFVPLTTVMQDGSVGLKKRINILANLAKILLQLHGLPVMYGSMSSDRVLVSKDAANEAVYLLYSVGMSYTMDFRQDYNSDPYIAPEMKDGQGGHTLSDIYAFAALAKDILTVSGSVEIPSEDIKFLLAQALDIPSIRPKLHDMYNAFIEAADLLIPCKQCGKYFYYTEASCPGCNTAPQKLLKATIYDKVSNTVVEKGVKIFEFSPIRQCLYTYHTGAVLLTEEVKPSVEFILNISKEKKLFLIFRNLLNKEININGKDIPAGQAHAVAMPCKLVQISIKLYSATARYIDIVIL